MSVKCLVAAGSAAVLSAACAMGAVLTAETHLQLVFAASSLTLASACLLFAYKAHRLQRRELVADVAATERA